MRLAGLADAVKLSAMPTRTLIASLLLAAAPLACGSDPNTSISDAGTDTTAASVGTTGNTSPTDTGNGPVTTSDTGDTSGSASATGSTTGTTTGEPDTFGSSTGSASGTTTTGETTTDQTTTASSTGPGETSGGAIENCDDLKAAFMAEAQEIRSCAADDECGQELKGTSCGCTQNWVARTDADATQFFALLDMADDLGCELILAGPCNCPEADGFVCVQGSCGWNYL